MIKGKVIKNDSNDGEYIIFESKLVEQVNPREYFKELMITSSFGFTHSFLSKSVEHYKLPIREQTVVKHSLKEAFESWKKFSERINELELSENYSSLLDSTKKREQIKLLKGAKMNSDILMAIIFKAWDEKGMTFSRYVSEHYPKNTDEEGMPRVAYLKDETIDKIGSTSLSDGQIKHVIENRKVIVANFMESDNDWICFFVTFDSLKGKEGWKNGTPHYHFISDKFQIPKEKVIRELKSKNYSLGNLPHIEITDKIE